MRAVHKYSIAFDDRERIVTSTSRSDPPCLFEKQGSDHGLYLWLEEPDPENKKYARIFRIFGTGSSIPEGWSWVASCQDPPYVWHLYEDRND